MKRFLVIPLMFLYLIAVSGVLVSLHYCGNELEGWEVYSKAGCAGGECGDEAQDSDGCCKDKVIAAKVSVDQKVTESYKLLVSGCAISDALLPQTFSLFKETFHQSAAAPTAYRANAPPGLWQNIPLYKLHGRFVYYG